MGDSVRRDDAWRAVAGLLDRAHEGPAALLVEGRAGMGKTTFLRDAVDLAVSRGFAVLATHGSSTDVPSAYRAVADLLDGIDGDIVAALPERQRMTLSDRGFGETGGRPAADERATATAFSSVLERLSERSPVLLVIDDVQWLDASSTVVIGFAARRLTGRVALLMAVRVDDAHPAGSGWPVLPHDEILSRTVLQPLSIDDVHTLIAARWSRALPRPIVARIHKVSAGNPMFALELARAEIAGHPSESRLPADLATLVQRRLDGVDGDAYTVLLTAACVGEPAVDVIGPATGLPDERVLDAVESLEALDVVRLDGNRIRFSHPLYAAGVLTGADPARRQAVHRALADVIYQPELRARHLALGSSIDDPDTLAALDAAADSLFARGALAAAADLVELALARGGSTGARRIRAAELHFRSGSVHRAREHLQSVLDGLPGGELRTLALAHLGAVQAYDDDLSGAIVSLSQAAAEASDVPALQLMCQIRLGLALAVADRIDESFHQARDAAALAERLDAPALRSQALALLVMAKFLRGDGVDHRALQTAVELEDPRSGATTFLRASAVEAMMPAYLGDFDTAEIRMREVRRGMVDDGTEIDLVWVDNRLATIEVWAGRYAAADATSDAAVRRAEQLGARLSLATAWTRRAAAAAHLGREADARADAHAAIDAARAMGAMRQLAEPARILGFLEVSLGDYAAAVDVMQPLLDAFEPPYELEMDGGGHLPDAVEALTALGRLGDAERLVAAMETHGARRDRAWLSAVGARGRGGLFVARGDLDAAEEALQRALEHHRRVAMPLELARTHLLLGEVQRLRRQTRVARTTLADALTVFEQLGATLWARRARDAMARLSTVGGAGLTAAERRTAELAVQGLSNSEIAAQLVVAKKTVEGNLSAAYRKLGIRSRTGLRAALAALDD